MQPVDIRDLHSRGCSYDCFLCSTATISRKSVVIFYCFRFCHCSTLICHKNISPDHSHPAGIRNVARIRWRKLNDIFAFCKSMQSSPNLCVNCS